MYNFYDKEFIGKLFFLLSLLSLIYITIISFTQISIWYDEYFSLIMVKGTLDELINLGIQDVHPLFYYLILKGFIDIFKFFGYNNLLIIGRLFSLIPFYILILFSFTKIKNVFNTMIAAMFSFFILTMPQLSFYIVQIRMYGWCILFLTCSFVYMYEIIKNPSYKNWIILTILSIFSVHSHYFSAVASIGIYISLFIILILKNKDQLKYWFLSSIACIIAFLPWLPSFLQQVTTTTQNFWIEEISKRMILSYVYHMFSPQVPFLTEPTIINPDILGTLMIIATIILFFYNILSEGQKSIFYYF